MHCPQVDQARFFPTGDDLYRETERPFGLRQEIQGILGDSQRIRGNGPNRFRRKPAQTLAKSGQGIKRALSGGFVKTLVGHQAGCQSHRLLDRIQWINLVVEHPANL
jgi:hypothetical protein